MAAQITKRICLIYQEDYPWDIRVEKIGCELVSAGHDVFLVCRNEARRARSETLNGLAISRLPALSDSAGRLNDIINFPLFINPLWILAISRCVRENKIDLIIVRDLPLALTAIAVGRYKRIPVVMDMAECYPELLRSMWRFGRLRLRNVLVRNPYAADVIEKIVINAIDHIFVVVEEAGERLVARGADEEKVSVVSNTAPLDKRDLVSVDSRRSDGNEIKLIYVGLLTRGRGLDTVLEGLSDFVKTGTEAVSLCVIGTGEWEAEYKQLAKELGLDRHVEFKGWIDNSKIMEYIRSSNVGVVPHHVCGHWDHTVPNKLFDYMAGGLAVLSSNTRPVSRIVKETGCGLVYEDFNRRDFKDCLLRLTDGAKRFRFGENGRKAVAEKYNWERDAKVMLDVIARLTTRKAASS